MCILFWLLSFRCLQGENWNNLMTDSMTLDQCVMITEVRGDRQILIP